MTSNRRIFDSPRGVKLLGVLALVFALIASVFAPIQASYAVNPGGSGAKELQLDRVQTFNPKSNPQITNVIWPTQGSDGAAVAFFTAEYSKALSANFDTSKVQVKSANVNLVNGKDFTATVVNGTTVKIQLTAPKPYTAGYADQLKIPFANPNEAGSYGAPYVQAWSSDPFFRPECSADRTSAEVTVHSNARDSSGQEIPTTVPSMTNTSKVLSRPQPARQLTEAESAAGSRNYIITSLPNKSERYESQLWYQQEGNGQFHAIGSEVGWVYNALAYNDTDNWLYGISQPRWQTGVISGGDFPAGTIDDPCFPSGHLLQIDPATGTVFDLGFITAPGSDASPFAQSDSDGGLNVGFFDMDGTLWVSNSSTSGEKSGRKLYKVDVTNGTGTPTSFASLSEDLSLLAEAPDYAWGIRSQATTDPKGQVQLERINLKTGEVKYVDISSLTTAVGTKIPANKNWGKSWVYGNGNLGFGTGSSGANNTFVQIRVNNPAGDLTSNNIELVSVTNVDSATPSFNTDGASRVTPAKKPDLSLKKTASRAEDGYLQWTLTVTNNGPGGSSGFILSDPLPQGYKLDVTCTGEDETRRCTTSGVTVGSVTSASGDTSQSDSLIEVSADYTKVFVHMGALPEKASVAVTIMAKIPDGVQAQCVSNTANITPNEADQNSGNNASTAEVCPTPPASLEFEKRAIDVQGTENGIGAGDSAQTESVDGVEYQTVKYDLIVTNSSDQTLPYTLVDTPQFTNDVTPAYVVVRQKSASGYDADSITSAGRVEYQDQIPVSWIINLLTGNKSAGSTISIAPHTTHYFEVKVLFTMNPATRASSTLTWDHLACKASGTGGTAGEGLFNTATLHDQNSNKDITDEACVPVAQTPFLSLMKVDADNRATKLDGADFAVYPSDNSGTFTGAKPVASVGGKFALTKGYFAIQETQAPAGYSLLAAPMYVDVVQDAATGDYRLFLMEKNPNTGALTRVSRASSTLLDIVDSKGNVVTGSGSNFSGVPADNNLFTVRIADVTTGSLPKTGGMGYIPAAVLGSLVAIGAIVSARSRRRTRA
ncbi:MAG: hypothetical protein SPI12_02570 [Actinomycetaceae bacterium]|nr:hypothetical protein [Actinomycetaceae bacterium]MDY6082733.1 hypothetical protein [Actinomycetaceae bacterium]